MAKAGSGLANTVVSATYEPTWNHLASITDALNHTTTFAYYASGNGDKVSKAVTLTPFRDRRWQPLGGLITCP